MKRQISDTKSKEFTPLVSIITPSYNQGRFIRETIESVLSQNYDNLEYIIIDGGSTDNTLEIVKEYQDRLIYISEKDNGQTDAINKGFKIAKGEIVAWLNSDDIYEPNCIEIAVKEFVNNENLGLVYGQGYIINEKSEKIKIFGATQEFDMWTLVNVWDYIMQPTTFFRKRYLEAIGYLDVDLNWCMDWDLWIRLAKVSEVKLINNILACSREYKATKTNSGGQKRLDEIEKFMIKNSDNKKPIGLKLYKMGFLYQLYEKNVVLRIFISLFMKLIYWMIFRNKRCKRY